MLGRRRVLFARENLPSVRVDARELLAARRFESVVVTPSQTEQTFLPLADFRHIDFVPGFRVRERAPPDHGRRFTHRDLLAVRREARQAMGEIEGLLHFALWTGEHLLPG